jgi:hypothetical protein
MTTVVRSIVEVPFTEAVFEKHYVSGRFRNVVEKDPSTTSFGFIAGVLTVQPLTVHNVECVQWGVDT